MTYQVSSAKLEGRVFKVKKLFCLSWELNPGLKMSKVKPVEESKSVKKDTSTQETKSVFSSDGSIPDEFDYLQPKTDSGEQGRVIFKCDLIYVPNTRIIK